MSKVNETVIKEKPMSARFAERRNAQEVDGAMIKQAPPGEDVVQTPGAIKTHPLEEAHPVMQQLMNSMEQVRQVLGNQYNAVKKVIDTGDTSHLLDQNLASNPEAWEKKNKEIISLLNKLLTLLPTV